MLKTFKAIKESEMAQELGIFVMEDEEYGIYTIADETTIKGLIGVFNMTSNYDRNGINKRNLEMKDMIFCILKDVEKELNDKFDEEIDITSILVNEIMEVRRHLIGDNNMFKEEMIEELENAQSPQLKRRMEQRIKHRYYSKNEEVVSLNQMIEVLSEQDCSVILKSRSFKQNREEIGDNMEKAKMIKELEERNFNNTQIGVILSIAEMDHFEYDYGQLSFSIEDDMSIGLIKRIQKETKELLEKVGLTASTYDSNFNSLVFDIDQFYDYE